MKLSLTDQKETKILELTKNMLSCNRVYIRELAKLIGNLVVSFPAVRFEPFFYRHPEKEN